MVNWLTSHPHVDVFFYLFDNETSYHSVDLNYIFGVPFIQTDVDEHVFCEKGCYYSPEGRNMSEMMMQILTQFAKDG